MKLVRALILDDFGSGRRSAAVLITQMNPSYAVIISSHKPVVWIPLDWGNKFVVLASKPDKNNAEEVHLAGLDALLVEVHADFVVHTIPQ